MGYQFIYITVKSTNRSLDLRLYAKWFQLALYRSHEKFRGAEASVNDL